VPAGTGHDDYRSRSHLEIGLDDLFRLRDDLRFFLLAAQVLGVEQRGQLPRLVPHRFVRCQQQPRGNIRRAHAPGGVDARRQHEADVITVDLLAGQAAHVEERAQPHAVRPPGQQAEAQFGDDAVLADERHHVGQCPDGGDLDERWQQAGAAGAAA